MPRQSKLNESKALPDLGNAFGNKVELRDKIAAEEQKRLEQEYRQLNMLLWREKRPDWGEPEKKMASLPCVDKNNDDDNDKGIKQW